MCMLMEMLRMANKNQYYKQCVLQKRIDDKRVRAITAFIPEQFAKKGKYIKVIDGKYFEILEEEGWSDGWEVVLAGTVRLDDAYVQERSRDYLRTRETSDV